MSGTSALRLAASIALCFAVAYAGARVTYPEIPTWYAGLSKPAWTPPNWTFPVVWNVLYLLMAVSLWLLWDRSAPSKARSIAIGLFLGQLALNAAWSPVFFALHLTQVALLIIIALAALLAVTIYQSLSVNRAAAWLLVPYLLWILYASTLMQASSRSTPEWRLSRPFGKIAIFRPIALDLAAAILLLFRYLADGSEKGTAKIVRVLLGPLLFEALKHLDRLGLMPRIKPLQALFIGDGKPGKTPDLRVVHLYRRLESKSGLGFWFFSRSRSSLRTPSSHFCLISRSLACRCFIASNTSRWRAESSFSCSRAHSSAFSKAGLRGCSGCMLMAKPEGANATRSYWNSAPTLVVS